MTTKRPTSLTVLAWFLIVVSVIGGAANVYAIASAVSPYPIWIWILLLTLKVFVIAAAYLLLKMRKAAVWLYLAVVIAEFAISAFLTRPLISVPIWQYAVSLALLAVYGVTVGRHWDKLQPTNTALGAVPNA